MGVLVMSLLNKEDLATLLVFEQLTSHWVREVHSYTSQRKKGKTFVIFRNKNNKKVSSLEELKKEIADSSFLDNVQFKSGHSHDIVSNKVGAGKIARRAANIWMRECAASSTKHDQTNSVQLIPDKVKHSEQKVTNKIDIDVNKNSSNRDSETNNAKKLPIAKETKEIKPPLNNNVKSAVCTSKKEPNSPPDKIETVKDKSDTTAPYTEESKEKPKLTADTKEDLIKEQPPVKQSSSAITIQSDLRDAWMDDGVGIMNDSSDEEQMEKEESVILSNNDNKKHVEDISQNKVSTPQPSNDLRDAWMDDDVGIMNDSSDEEQMEKEETKILSNSVIPNLLEDISQNKVYTTSQPSNDLRDAWMNDDVCIMNDSSEEDEEQIEKDGITILQISDNKKDDDDTSQNKIFLTETIDIETRCKKQNILDPTIKSSVLPLDDAVVTIKEVKSDNGNTQVASEAKKSGFAGLPLDESADTWMDDDVGSIQSEEDITEEEMESEDRKCKMVDNMTSLNIDVPQKQTDLVNVLQTFLTENDDKSEEAKVESVPKVLKDVKTNKGNKQVSFEEPKSAFAGLPLDEVADAWMQDDVGLISSEEDSSEEEKETDGRKTSILDNEGKTDGIILDSEPKLEKDNKTETEIEESTRSKKANVSHGESDLVNVLQTFLEENEDKSADVTLLDKKEPKTDIDKETVNENKSLEQVDMSHNQSGLVDVLQAFLEENEEISADETAEIEKENSPLVKGDLPHSQGGLVDVLQTFMSENNEKSAGVQKELVPKIVKEDHIDEGNSKEVKDKVVKESSPPKSDLVGVLQSFLSESESATDSPKKEEEPKKNENKTKTILDESDEEDSSSEDNTYSEGDDSDFGSSVSSSDIESEPDLKLKPNI